MKHGIHLAGGTSSNQPCPSLALDHARCAAGSLIRINGRVGSGGNLLAAAEFKTEKDPESFDFHGSISPFF